MTTEPKNDRKREDLCPFSACTGLWASDTEPVPCIKYLPLSHRAVASPSSSKLVGLPPSMMPSQSCPQDDHLAQETWAGAGGLTYRGNEVGTQGQEQEAGYRGCGVCHLLESRGGSSVLKVGMQEKGWEQWSWFLTEHPNLLCPL